MAVLVTFTMTAVGLVGTAGKWVGLLRPTRVKITGTDVRPDPRSSNTRLLAMSGSFENIGDGELLWLAIRPPGDSRIYPNARPCDTNATSKTWSCSILFGTPTPGRPALFHVVIMRANARAVNAFLDYQSSAISSFPGLPGLPAGAIKGDEMDVPVQ
ncbi:MAG: hypothetical protein JO364_07350 [Pseudonocardiales bacterium]|nr:hypothetical protein [Pseudonocardiales bacterium]MBV9030115.1 hypothetical protein [Pseudonocardiales bacterium]